MNVLDSLGGLGIGGFVLLGIVIVLAFRFLTGG